MTKTDEIPLTNSSNKPPEVNWSIMSHNKRPPVDVFHITNYPLGYTSFALTLFTMIERRDFLQIETDIEIVPNITPLEIQEKIQQAKRYAKILRSMPANTLLDIMQGEREEVIVSDMETRDIMKISKLKMTDGKLILGTSGEPIILMETITEEKMDESGIEPAYEVM